MKEQYRYEESFHYYDSAAQLAARSNSELEYVVATIGMGVAYRYRESPDLDKAFQYFIEAYDILNELKEFDTLVYIDLHYHLATTERRRLNYKAARDYAFGGLYLSQQPRYIELKAKCYSILANIYQDQNRFDSAFLYYDKVIALRSSRGITNDSRLVGDLSNYAMTLTKTAGLRKSIELTETAIKLVRSFTNRTESELRYDTLEIAHLYNILGRAYGKLNDFKAAISYYSKSLDFDSSEFVKTVKYHEMADLFLKFNQPDSALFYYQKALVAGIPEFAPRSEFELPQLNLDSIDDLNEEVIDVLDKKASIFVRSYHQSEDLAYLKGAAEIYTLLDEIIFRRRFLVDFDDPSLHLAEHFESIYDRGLNVLFELFEATKDDDLMAVAYRFIERNKHLLLLKRKLHQDNAGIKNTTQLISNAQAELEEYRYRERSRMLQLKSRIPKWKRSFS